MNIYKRLRLTSNQNNASKNNNELPLGVGRGGVDFIKLVDLRSVKIRHAEVCSQQCCLQTLETTQTVH